MHRSTWITCGRADSLNTGANDYFIYAPTSGVIHMDSPYKEGMVLSAGSALATVASENDDLEIMAMVTVNDRPLLHVGDPCKIAITGLSEYSYGTLTGTVTSIDSDVTSSNNGSYYKMTIKPDATYVVSRSGDKVDLSNGMSVTARVEYDQVTYFEYAMELWACCSAKNGLRSTAGCPLLHHPQEVQTTMIRTAKKLAACVLMLGVLVCGTALSAAAASLPVEEQNAFHCHGSRTCPPRALPPAATLPICCWALLSSCPPVVSPSYSTDSVVFLTDDSSVLTVSSSGVVQAVGVGTATVTAAAGNQICAYTIVVSMDSSMIVTEMDLSLSSNTIYVATRCQLRCRCAPALLPTMPLLP